MIDYIKWIREKVGHDPIILNFSSAIIVNEKNEILLQKRYKDKNIWGIIGGIMNYGESSAETVIREAKEETNLDIDVDYLSESIQNISIIMKMATLHKPSLVYLKQL